MHGTGSQRRTFTHIADTVDATYRLSLHENAAGEVYNIGGSIEVSILELAVAVHNRVNSSSEIKRVPYAQAFSKDKGFEDMQRRVPNCEKLNQLIGYKPRYSLNDMIDSVIESYLPAYGKAVPA